MSRRFFWIGCALEAGLTLVAITINALARRPLLSDLDWNPAHAWAGCLATLPVLALFLFLMRSSQGPLGGLRSYLQHQIRPLFVGWNTGQLLLISLLAGFGEELLFRGVIQSGLTHWLGTVPGLVLGSLIFGACHPMTAAYLVVTTFMGVYLGSLWIITGNLLAPVITHALYDFLALVYLVRGPK